MSYKRNACPGQIATRLYSQLGLSFPINVNCFSISELFFRKCTLGMKTADEMLDFVSAHLKQVDSKHIGVPILYLVWSRSNTNSNLNQINIHTLANREAGFPFNLVLEHSFVNFNTNLVVQKADPSLDSKVEIMTVEEALKPYVHKTGYEVTMHIELD